MGRAPCCDKANVKKGPWSPEEDAKLKDYIDKHGTGGSWIALPQKAGLKRCGKSCRLRWLNYLRPNIKHGEFTDDEDRLICTLYANIGSRWSIIAAQLPGRTDNDIKNYWNTKLKKKLMSSVFINPPGKNLSHGMVSRPEHEQHLLINPFSQTIPTLSPSVPCSSTSDFYDLSPFSYSSSPPTTTLMPQENIINPISVYGSHEAATASCSSSDGSSIDRDHIPHQRFDHHQQIPNNDLQGLSSPYYGNDHQFLVPGDQDIVNYNYNNSGASLDSYYGAIEEIKQLISNTTSSLTSANSNCNHSGFAFNVENRNNSPDSAVPNLVPRIDEGLLYYH